MSQMLGKLPSFLTDSSQAIKCLLLFKRVTGLFPLCFSGLAVRLLLTHSFCWDSQCHPFHTIIKSSVGAAPQFGPGHRAAVLHTLASLDMFAHLLQCQGLHFTP